MALNFAPSSSLSTASLRFQAATKNNLKKQPCYCKAAQSEEIEDEVTILTGSSTRSQLDLLEQLTSSTSSSGGESDSNTSRLTIREQLSELVRDRRGEFSLPLGKKPTSGLKSLTISQKRNIKRQAYLNEVSRRNDSIFFATIGAFVILPPILILVVAVITGYVQLFP